MLNEKRLLGANPTIPVVLLDCEELPYKTEVKFLGDRIEHTAPLNTYILPFTVSVKVLLSFFLLTKTVTKGIANRSTIKSDLVTVLLTF